MSTSMEPAKNFQATVPPLLLKKIKDAAEAECISVDEFVRDAMERRLGERRRQNLYAYGEEQARQRLRSQGRQERMSDDEVMEYVDCVVHEFRDEERERERQDQERGR